MGRKPKLSLTGIQNLGGTKEDLDLLEGVDEDSASDLDFGTVTGNGDDEHQEEIKAYLKDLGLCQNLISTEEKNLEPANINGEEAKKKKKKKKKKDEVRAIEEEAKVNSLEQEEPGRVLMKVRIKEYKKMLFPLDSGKRWFEQSNSSLSTTPVSPAILNHLTKIGEDLMQTEVVLYERVRVKSKGEGDVRWLKTVLSSGVLSDKVAALILLIQESPVHTLSYLDTLLGMASKKGKRESIIATDTLKELWMSDLLPEDRKLKSMKQRPFHVLAEEPSDRVCHMKLLLWYYEDQLKIRFAKYLSIVKVLSHDSVANIREKMLGAVFDLLYRRPEQEKELLSQLVNKLGDPVKKVASKAVLFLLKLLNHHVNMKTIVAMEMKCLLYRPNISQRAQYYAVCTLNQFTIGQDDQELATSLVEIYFTFFKVYATKKELDAKMLAALLTGVNRAFPFTKGQIPSFDDHLKSLFKVVHVGPLATGIQSLMLLYQVMESQQAVSGRYYQALYLKLMDPRLKHSGRQAIFLNLLSKSLKSDPETNRVKAFLKRILQVCANHDPPFVCGCLFLISEVLKLRLNLWAFVLQSELTDEEHFIDVPENSGG